MAIEQYFTPNGRIHMVGIGGVSMAPLAEVLHGAGVTISGSDMKESEVTDHLRSLGIPIVIGHFEDNSEGADCVIRTAAAHDDNPEILGARSRNIPVYERAEGWGAIMKQYQNALCVSGTHGKTTTTAMCIHIFMAAHRDPTVMLGGHLPLMGCGHRVGEGDTIILESCEYCNSFHSFFPTVAVILNVEADHMDFFHSLEEVRQSFHDFAALVPDGGMVVANGEDENTMLALENLHRPTLTFGVEKGDVHGGELRWDRGFATFNLIYRGENLGEITLRVPGIHNVKNALAAAASALVLGVAPRDIIAGLEEFSGAGRRFEYWGTVNGAAVYDDYAHHPHELEPLLTTAQNLGYRRVVCAFQPHTYTRTIEFFDDFIVALKLADVVVLMEIYAAREENKTGISSKDLADQIPNAIFCKTLDEVGETLRNLAQEGDLILTVGAGELNQVAEKIVQ